MREKIRTVLLLLFMQALAWPALSQTVIYVDVNAHGLNNGTSWANAFQNLDSALSKGQHLTYTDSIKVAQGIYKPSLLPKGAISTDPRDVSFLLPQQVNILGGYQSGTYIRDPFRYQTILSGDIGRSGDTTDNAYHVVLALNDNCYFSGFTIQDGNANNNGTLKINSITVPHNQGAGLYMIGSYFEMDQLVFQKNQGFYGAGFKVKNSTIDLSKSYFIKNNSYLYGGGIHADSTELNILNAVFYQNSCVAYGAGIYFSGQKGYLGLHHATLVGNSASMGGGVFVSWNDSSNISNCVFEANMDYDRFINFPYTKIGADIFDSLGTSKIESCLLETFISNTNCVHNDSAYFQNAGDPYGKDGVLGTADDGLILTASSGAYKLGINWQFPQDIIGTHRDVGSTFDLGAYENSGYLQIRNRTVYVDSAAKGNNSGVDWANAFTDFESASNTSFKGFADTIYVAKGTYTPRSSPRYDPVEYNNHTFDIWENNYIMGGYSSGGTERDPVKYKSILSGSPSNPFHVVMITEKRNITFDGMTFANAHATTTGVENYLNRSYPSGEGGGVFIDNSYVSLILCNFENNIASLRGGALRASNSHVAILGCNFYNNQVTSTTEGTGGAVFVTGAQKFSGIETCIFQNNRSALNGGAVSSNMNGTNFAIDNTYFIGNKAVGTGGGMFIDGNSSTSMTQLYFDKDSAYNGGGAGILTNVTNTIKASYFTNNYSANNGAAVHANNLDLIQCIFYSNKSIGNGGAIYSFGTMNLYHSDLVKNSAHVGGGISNISTLNMYNNIVWANTADGNANIAGSDLYSTVNIGAFNNAFQVFTTIQDYNNTVNINPQFLNIENPIGKDNKWGTTDDGLTLDSNSFLINHGKVRYSADLITKDITDQPRVVCTIPDIGAYEYQGCGGFSYNNHTLYVDSSVVNNGNLGQDWEHAIPNLDSALRLVDSFKIDTIKIAKGTYTPGGDGFTLPKKIVIEGGYPSGGGNQDFKRNKVHFYKHTSNGLIIITDQSNIVLEGIILTGNPPDGIIQLYNPTRYKIGIQATNSKIVFNHISIEHCNIEGAIISLQNCTGTISNSLFAYDSSNGASGIRCNGSPIHFMNCLFYKNKSYIIPAVLEIYNSEGLSLTNCTFYGNFTKNNYGNIHSDNTPYISNCLFWRNRTIFLDTSYINELTTINYIPSRIKNSLFEFQPQGPGTINCVFGKYPAFLDSTNILGADQIFGTADDGLSLSDSSIAINHGDNSLVPSGITTDITGNDRIKQGIVDIGAYENDSASHSSCPVIQPDFSFSIDSLSHLVKFTDLTPQNHSLYNNTIKWYFGDGDSSSIQSPQHKYLTDGIYKVRMVYSNSGGCAKDTSKEITILTPKCNVTANFSISGDRIAPASIHFLNHSTPDSGVTFKWYFGTGDSSINKNPDYTFVQPGSYKVSLHVFKNPGCYSSFDSTIIIDSVVKNCNGKAEFSWSGGTVAPAKIQFKNGSTPSVSLTWDFGDGSLSTELNPQHIYLLPGSYTVSLGAYFGGNCYDSIFKTIVINPPTHPDTCLMQPSFVFIYDTTKERTVQFRDVTISNKPIISYKWDFGDGGSSTIANPVHQFSTIGVHKVCLQVSTDSCMTTYCDSVTINPSLAIPIVVYPNPVGPLLTVSFKLAIQDNVDVVIYNEYGLMVKKVTYSAISGVNTFMLPVSNLSPGVYIIQINSVKNIPNSIKFIKM